jgi:hypothetical protein
MLIVICFSTNNLGVVKFVLPRHLSGTEKKEPVEDQFIQSQKLAYISFLFTFK